jgi:hypothetical protein
MSASSSIFPKGGARIEKEFFFFALLRLHKTVKVELVNKFHYFCLAWKMFFEAHMVQIHVQLPHVASALV